MDDMQAVTRMAQLVKENEELKNNLEYYKRAYREADDKRMEANNRLYNNAREIACDIVEKIKAKELTMYDEVSEFLKEEVDSYLTYTSDCWDMAKSADIESLDSGLWEGADSTSQMIAGIAYAALEQEVWDKLGGSSGVKDLIAEAEEEEEEEEEETEESEKE